MRTASVGAVRAIACGALALGLASAPLMFSESAAATKKAGARPSGPAFQAPSFNPTDPILKCTAYVKNGASAYAVVQIPIEMLDDASIAWEKSYPDHPVCDRLSADDAIGFLRSTRINPNWIDSHWRPGAEAIKAAAADTARPPSPEEQRQAAADQAVEQALAAVAKRDYTTALAMARKAAELGRPMDKDQVAYFTEQSARQETAAAGVAKAREAQQAAAATAAQIMERQQKDYAESARQAKVRAEANQPNEAVAAMGGQALGGYSKSLGSAIQNDVAHGAIPTQANAVGNGAPTTAALPSTLRTYRVASDCITLDKVTISVDKAANGPGGASLVAMNSCGYKVAFQWCVKGARSCGRDGGLPEGQDEIAAKGRVSIANPQATEAQVRIWACQSPGTPRRTSDTEFECR